MRTRAEKTAVYVSVGHKMDLQSAAKYVIGATRGYRIPEPAHLAAAGRPLKSRKAATRVADVTFTSHLDAL